MVLPTRLTGPPPTCARMHTELTCVLLTLSFGMFFWHTPTAKATDFIDCKNTKVNLLIWNYFSFFLLYRNMAYKTTCCNTYLDHCRENCKDKQHSYSSAASYSSDEWSIERHHCWLFNPLFIWYADEVDDAYYLMPNYLSFLQKNPPQVFIVSFCLYFPVKVLFLLLICFKKCISIVFMDLMTDLETLAGVNTSVFIFFLDTFWQFSSVIMNHPHEWLTHTWKSWSGPAVWVMPVYKKMKKSICWSPRNLQGKQ